MPVPMQRLEFVRKDLDVQIERDKVRVAYGEVVDEFMPVLPEDPGLFLDRSDAVYRWSKELPHFQYQILHRVTLDIRERKLQTHDWESAVGRYVRRFRLHPSARPILVLRLSPVRPRSSNFPFTLPLRMIEVNAAGNGRIVPALKKIFHQPLETYEAAFRVASANWKRWDEFALPTDWPTAEVIHFNRLPRFPKGQMLSGDATVSGTLGWFVERLVEWQVRLVVLISRTASEIKSLQQFASAILSRGGPAVVVDALQNATRQRHFYSRFYEKLIHDFPIDVMWHDASFAAGSSKSQVKLFVGAGREEQLRPSNVAADLVKFASKLNMPRRREALDKTLLRKVSTQRRSEVLANLESGFRKLRTDWKRYRFEFRESAGLLPLSERLTDLRSNLTGPAPTVDLLPKTAVDPARYVNCSFWEADLNSKLNQIDQKEGAFEEDLLYQLGIQIGPKNSAVITVNETVLVEEVFKWKPDMKGVWIEIGISGIDFDVVGDPVQRVWLPAPGGGPTEAVYFSVIPRKAGVNRLRFAIYYEQNIIQSFRVGLITGKVENRAAALAKALDIRKRLSADVSYLPVVEFSLPANIDDFVSQPSYAKRTVAILANDLGGDSIVTVKNASSFGVNVNNLVSDQVSKLHKELLEISNLDQNNRPYPFTPKNEATKASLESSLRILAERGTTLFTSLIDSNIWGDIRRDLDQPDQTIQVGQILRDKVIPWSFVYERPLKPRAGDRDQTGKLTNIPVCLAALPDKKGTLPVQTCGSSPSCLLQTNQNLKPENVVCPLQFWGFKHVVEIPPRQINNKGKATPAAVKSNGIQTAIKVNGSARVVAGANGSFSCEDAHFKALAKLQTKFPVASLKQVYTSAEVLDELAISPIHIAYFFCHAEGGGSVNSQLRLQKPLTNVEEFIQPYEFSQLLGGNQKWDPPALVFLNGCKTANYSPEALSPFLQCFVDHLGASGMIGTEITVWDVFAAEVGSLFLEGFLNGDHAGDSLLKARRILLSKNNVLGLVYTLYASADLHLE